MATAARKQDRSAGISYQELLDGDIVPAEETLRRIGVLDVPLVSVPVDRYRTKAFHDLEMERLWPRVWQMACREEEISEVGDYVVYEIGSFSILVVRTASGIRAQHNVCRHRGRKLCTEDGHAASFICPFHGMSWNLDGSLRGVTSEWDFPHIDKKNFDLNKVLVDTWGGWVFINMDLKAEPFAKFIGELPDHFKVWSPEKRYIEAHVAKIMSCNWKLCQEAFMEAFHVITTHPQILVGIGDENSQYDAWGNFSRAITPNATPSPHLRFKPSEQELFDAVTMKYLDAEGAMEIPKGARARGVLAEGARMALQSIVGKDTPISDAAVSDSIYYTLFPNFHPWGGYNRIVYRFRPYKNHHDKSIMECYYLSPFVGERPAPAKTHWLNEDQHWTEADELGVLAKVFTQDTFNLPHVQLGLEAAQYDEVVLARYQETKIRHFHHLLSKWIAA